MRTRYAVAQTSVYHQNCFDCVALRSVSTHVRIIVGVDVKHIHDLTWGVCYAFVLCLITRMKNLFTQIVRLWQVVQEDWLIWPLNAIFEHNIHNIQVIQNTWCPSAEFGSLSSATAFTHSNCCTNQVQRGMDASWLVLRKHHWSCNFLGRLCTWICVQLPFLEYLTLYLNKCHVWPIHQISLF